MPNSSLPDSSFPNNSLIINAQVPGFQGEQQIDIQQGVIRAIAPRSSSTPPSDRPILDVASDWVSLGGVDLQINGALGLPFPELDAANADQLPGICQYLWDQGVDGFLPTIVTTSVANIRRSLAILADYIATPSPPAHARILGVHLEGPFLNPQKRGAHPQEHLLPLTLDQVRRVIGDHADIIKVMTVAPELDETDQVIPYVRSLGITVSLGHSLATATQAQRAFAQGATMITHAFNAMPPLHHRDPGLLGAAITDPNVHYGLIADGQHVAPLMIEILLRASQYDQGVFLVSDALSPLGLPDGSYPWDSRSIEVKQGTARLPDGTLSGTTWPLLVGVQNLVKWKICDVGPAIALATLAPRAAIGLSSTYIHQPASLLRWHHHPDGNLTWARLDSEN
jgi:N-acetylglucosamine-6-phosphate deacetylase